MKYDSWYDSFKQDGVIKNIIEDKFRDGIYIFLSAVWQHSVLKRN